MSVTTSSLVGWITKSRSWRSLMRKSSGPIFSKRPVSCQNSAGCTTGIVSSTAPARFISSRTIASTLRITRRPMGMYV
ncbi:hypothetical protein FQZ97_657480 [compost metagenome]